MAPARGSLSEEIFSVQSRAGADRGPEAGEDHQGAEHRVHEEAGGGLGAPPHRTGRRPTRPPAATTQSGQTRTIVNDGPSPDQGHDEGEDRRDREEGREHRRGRSRRRWPLRARRGTGSRPATRGRRSPRCPAAYAAASPMARPTNPAITPFSVSRNMTSAPQPLPSTRMVLSPPGIAAPRLADVDRSAARRSRATRSAEGNVPIR